MLIKFMKMLTAKQIFLVLEKNGSDPPGQRPSIFVS
jgi:hypothetical protein